MNLYIATRYGNHIDDDPNEKDTNFFVKANSFEEAYELANYRLNFYDSPNTSDKVHVISLIAKIHDDNEAGVTMFSPLIEFGYAMSITPMETKYYED